MYYNKELFVNKEIKATYERLNKLLVILILSIVTAVIVIVTAVIIVFGIKNPDTFMTGYAMAVFGICLVVLVLSIALPFQAKLDKLRCMQTEELKGQPLYEKYRDLLDLGRKRAKISGYIAFVGLGVGIIASWVLAIIFPYEIFSAYGYVVTMLICNSVILFSRKDINKIKSSEEEILKELHAKRLTAA